MENMPEGPGELLEIISFEHYLAYIVLGKGLEHIHGSIIFSRKCGGSLLRLGWRREHYIYTLA